jgi:hypothetical protein
MDFSGSGTIDPEIFAQSLSAKKCGYDESEVKEYVLRLGTLTFEKFKKTFFPYLFLLTDEKD